MVVPASSPTVDIPDPTNPSPCYHTAEIPKCMELWGHPCHQPGTPRIRTKALSHDRDSGKKKSAPDSGVWILFKANSLSLGHSSKVQDPVGR